MAGSILVLVETKDGKIKKASLELLSQASRMASSLGGDVKALFIGKNIKSVAVESGAYGAKEAFVADADAFESYSVERFRDVCVETISKSGATVFMATAGSLGKDLLPRVAANLNAGMLTECTALACDGGKVKATRPVYAGKVFVDASIDGALQVISCRANVFEIGKPESGKNAVVTEVGQAASQVAVRAKIVETIASKSDRPDLTEASSIVAGGRALKSGENFKVLYDMADVLGGAVGASRAAVDAGFVSHNIQVGQTGKTVNPPLYIAAGISGAIQHLAGMKTSKVIVAINTDPEAPIFQISNYGIVGDLFQVVPAMTEELKKLLKE